MEPEVVPKTQTTKKRFDISTQAGVNDAVSPINGFTNNQDISSLEFGVSINEKNES